MPFPNSEPWTYSDSQLRAYGLFALNFSHLEFELRGARQSLAGVNEDVAKALWRRQGTFGQTWETVKRLLRAQLAPEHQCYVDELAPVMDSLNKFRSTLIHGAWLPRHGHDEFRRWETNGVTGETVGCAEIEAKVAEVAKAFRGLRNSCFTAYADMKKANNPEAELTPEDASSDEPPADA